MTTTSNAFLEPSEERMDAGLVRSFSLDKGAVSIKFSPQPADSRISKRKQRKRRTELDPGDDGYRWHKYGQKTLMDTTFIRGYYRCAQKGTGCQAKKMVDNHASGNSTLRITYDGQHNHPMPQTSREINVPKNLPLFSSPGVSRHSSGTSSITTIDPESDEEPLKANPGASEVNPDSFFLSRLNESRPLQIANEPRNITRTKSNSLDSIFHPFDFNSASNAFPIAQTHYPGFNSNETLMRSMLGLELQHPSTSAMYRSTSLDTGKSLAKFRTHSPKRGLKLDLTLGLPD